VILRRVSFVLVSGDLATPDLEPGRPSALKQARSLVEEAIHRFGIHHACGFSETCEDSRPWRVPPLEVFMGDKSPKSKQKNDSQKQASAKDAANKAASKQANTGKGAAAPAPAKGKK
jgi:hypothetical protein